MKKNSIQIWIGVIVVIVIALLIFFVLTSQQTVKQSTTGSDSVAPDSVQDIGTQDIGIGAAPISYANALIKYADRRIQLDLTCQAHPIKVTYKDNTGIMIDNRSPQARTVKVGTTFTIKPYGFKIVVLPDIYLVQKTLLVDCDQRQNIATILIQE